MNSELRSQNSGIRRSLASWFAVCVLSAAFCTGCKNPFERTRDASGGGALGSFGGSGRLVVFSNELTTGGGAFLYPGSENQSLVFNDTSNPVSARSIRYNWNGQDVSSQFGLIHTFAGFDLMNKTTQADYAASSNRGVDLRAAGYTHVTFWARGTLSANTLVKVEVAEPSTTPGPCKSLSTSGTLDDGVNNGSTACGVTGVLSANWQQYSISFPSSDLATLKDYFKATFIFNQPGGTVSPGSGGTVYFDNIQYTQ